MRKDRRKHHIISLRVSTEEWNTLQETMRGMQLQRVSDLMREGFKMLLAPTDSLQDAVANRQERTS